VTLSSHMGYHVKYLLINRIMWVSWHDTCIVWARLTLKDCVTFLTLTNRFASCLKRSHRGRGVCTPLALWVGSPVHTDFTNAPSESPLIINR
jgi:hypothetical protein